ncbi:MAG: hypothetical protein Q9175_001872 [Cornicularia normoerica]
MARYNAFDGTTIALTAVFLPLALLAVVLRIVARRRTKANVGLDDLLAIFALVIYFCFSAMVLWGTENGGDGYDLPMLPPATLKIQLKATYAATIFSASAISVAKFSILMLYRRTFSTDKRFQLAVLIVAIMSIAWWVAASLGAALRCTPVESQLNPLIQGKCYNVQHFFIAVEIPNCLLDFAIVAMPIGVIQGLHLQLKHKITLCFIFLLGSFVGFISVIRMALVYRLNGPDFNAQSGYWLQIQLSVAIVCICLPTLRPLIPRGSPFTTKLKTYYHSLFGHSTQSSEWNSKRGGVDDRNEISGPKMKRAKHYKNLSEDSSDKIALTNASPGDRSRDANGTKPDAMQAIAVERDANVV